MASFLSPDGLLDIAEIILLARDIEKLAVAEGLKPAELYFSGKVIPKYDKERAKKGGEMFEKKRHQIIKKRARIPATGSRLKMQVLLKNYKGLEEFGEYYKDFKAALKAIERNNAKAEKFIARTKADGAKKRDKMNADFDKNLDCFIDSILMDGDQPLKGVDFAVGRSMMGKTLIVKLPNGGFVSVGKADKERFTKARDAEDAADAEPPKKPARKSRR